MSPGYNSAYDMRGKYLMDVYYDIVQCNYFFYDGQGGRLQDCGITASNAILAQTCSVSIRNIQISSSFASQSLSASYASTYVEPVLMLTMSNDSTSSLLIQDPTIYNGSFINYVVTDGVNYRAGTIVAVYTTSSINIAETTTTDVGSVGTVYAAAQIVGGLANVLLVNDTDNTYSIRYTTRQI